MRKHKSSIERAKGANRLLLQVIISISVVMVLTSVLSFCLKTMPQFRRPTLVINTAYCEDTLEQNSLGVNVSEGNLHIPPVLISNTKSN